ncbi:hypothetical protein C9374_004478 [Naegleria lovaniensis]|uniref:Uncharacterized protein n=1 Tax=Naegleria lovaniensis TaxID=51637 RepID=A0AA88GPZ2_NAELO|nr:uncharacterized protein C9374_004478 [Naegleria lovaniensis]KAG2383141.1 hypothetical protein C9374_004478 [Naegleria lovaniensis]
MTTTERKSGLETLAKFLALHPSEKGEVCLAPNISFFQNSKTLNETIKEKGWTLKPCEYMMTYPSQMTEKQNYVFNRSDFVGRSSAILGEDDQVVVSSSSFNSQNSSTSRSSRKTSKSPKSSSSAKKKKRSKKEAEDFVQSENEDECIEFSDEENIIMNDEEDDDENQPKVHRTRSRVKQQQQQPPSLSSQPTKSIPSASKTTKTSAATTSKNKTIDSFFKTVEMKAESEDDRKEHSMIISDDSQDVSTKVESKTTARKFLKKREEIKVSTNSPTKVSPLPANSAKLEDIFKNLQSDQPSTRSIFSSPTKNSTTKRVVTRKK